MTAALSPESRERALDVVTTEELDVLVVGGGVTGSGGSANGAPSTAVNRAAQVMTPTCARTVGRRMKRSRGC